MGDWKIWRGEEAGGMVLRERIELSTSPLPRECSTTELPQHLSVFALPCAILL